MPLAFHGTCLAFVFCFLRACTSGSSIHIESVNIFALYLLHRKVATCVVQSAEATHLKVSFSLHQAVLVFAKVRNLPIECNPMASTDLTATSTHKSERGLELTNTPHVSHKKKAAHLSLVLFHARSVRLPPGTHKNDE